MFWNISNIYFFFLACKTLWTAVMLSFSIFSQSSFSEGKFFPSWLYLFIKGLVFVILCGSFFIYSWFHASTTAYWKHLLSFLLMEFIVVFFIQLGESLYDPSRLRFFIIITELNQRQTHYLSLTPNDVDVYF